MCASQEFFILIITSIFLSETNEHRTNVVNGDVILSYESHQMFCCVVQALLRSPEVVRFLQKRQSLLQITQARNMTAVDLNDGEVEDDGQHSS